jgi:Uncharacterised protein family (UPF0014)
MSRCSSPWSWSWLVAAINLRQKLEHEKSQNTVYVTFITCVRATTRLSSSEMSNDPITPGKTHLTWINVAIGSGFVLFDAVLSQLAGLQVGSALIAAAVRCAVQLALMGTVLRSVFEMEGWGGVVIVAGVLNLMGTFEVGEYISFYSLFTLVYNGCSH